MQMQKRSGFPLVFPLPACWCVDPRSQYDDRWGRWGEKKRDGAGFFFYYYSSGKLLGGVNFLSGASVHFSHSARVYYKSITVKMLAIFISTAVLPYRYAIAEPFPSIVVLPRSERWC